MAKPQERLEGVAVNLKANVYFDGGVVSHTLIFPNGKKKTVGVIRPGRYHFNTDSPESMDIIAGRCRVLTAGEKEWKSFTEGQSFHVPGKSSFDIEVETGLAEYICSFE